MTQLLFSAEGRLARAPFWLTALGLLGVLTAFTFTLPPAARAATGWLVFFVLFVAGCCVSAKRLHDRGHAGWWSAAPMFALVWAWSQPSLPMRAVVSFAILWALGVLGGQAGWNRFGPQPGAPC